MAKKERTATDKLNVALAGIDSAITIAKSVIGDDHPQAASLLETALERCEEARAELLSIQFHAAQI